MPLLPLQIPPGMVRPGTKYDSKGRWFDGNLVRWAPNGSQWAMRPVGGWTPLVETDPVEQDVGVDGPVRGMLAWRNDGSEPHLAMGTNISLWAFFGGALHEITPVGFTGGGINAEFVSGQYGAGSYGSGAYGFGIQGQGVLVEANTWQLDTFGQFLVANAYSDGLLYIWDLSVNPATPIANAPTGNRGVVVTPERFVVALASNNDPRQISWSDQEDETVWAPAPGNQAGDIRLVTTGEILAGRRSRDETLIWTDVDLWTMRYIGGTLVYSFRQLGNQCGAISRRSMLVRDGVAYWMGDGVFFSYDGFVRTIPCDVADYVFGDFNKLQASKVHVYSRAEFDEITWHYPSAASDEIDRYVTFNRQGGFWSVGQLNRTSGVDRSAFGFPIAANSFGGVWQHEVVEGTYDDDAGGFLVPFAESGPIEIGAGDAAMVVLNAIPDTNTLGEANISFYSSFYPAQEEAVHGPFPLANPTNVRFQGRQIRLRIDTIEPNWRHGTTRIEVVPAGVR